MRRYWVDKSRVSATHVVLDGEEFHHIVGVCRQEVGSRFEVLVEGNQALLVELETLSKKSAIARVIESRKVPSLPQPWLNLVMGVPRFPVFEAVLEKCVELGVKSVTPLFSDFSFVKSEIPFSKQDRWSKIIKSATQQSGRGDLMVLQSPQKIANYLHEYSCLNVQKYGLFAYEGETTLNLKQAVGRILLSTLESKSVQGHRVGQNESGQIPPEVYLFVGGEGGWSVQEAELFRSKGLEPVTLGSQVLRVETACIALLSVLKYELDLWRRFE